MKRTIVLFWLGFTWSLSVPAAARLDAIGFVDLVIEPGFSIIANPLRVADNTVQSLFQSARGGVPEGTTLFKLAEPNAAAPPLSEELQKTLVDGILGKLPKQLGGSVGIKLDGGNVVLEWSGTLLTAPEAAGPYVALDPVPSPLQFAPSEARQFWQAQVAAPLEAARFTANMFRAGAWSDPGQTLVPGEGALIFNPAAGSFVVPFDGQIPSGRLINAIPANWSLRANMLPLTGGITLDAGLELSPGDHVFFWERGEFREFALNSGKNWVPFEPQLRAGQAFFVFANKATVWSQDFPQGQ